MGDVIPIQGSEYSRHTGTAAELADARELAFRTKSVEDERARLAAVLEVLNDIYRTTGGQVSIYKALNERELILRQKWEQAHGVDSIQYYDDSDYLEDDLESAVTARDYLKGSPELAAIDSARALKVEGVDFSQPLTAEALELITNAISNRFQEIAQELERVYAGGYTDAEQEIIDNKKLASENKEKHLRAVAQRLITRAQGYITQADIEKTTRESGLFDRLKPSELGD